MKKNNTMKLIIGLFIAMAIVAFTPMSHAADGKVVYGDSCAKCHGDDGKGATKMGAKLGARDYTDAKVQASLTDADATKAIKDGLKKDDKTLMKPFSDLSDADVAAVIAYMRTFKQ